VDKETLDKEIQRAFQHYQQERLKLDDLCALTGISKGSLKHTVHKHYDSWADACEANGGKCGPTTENLKLIIAYSKEDCRQEALRLAALVAPKCLTQDLFNEHAKFSTAPIYSLWGRNAWTNFMREIGLPLSDSYHETVSLEMLADDFLKAFDAKKKKIPTLMRIARLSKRTDSIYRKNGYPAFKRTAIEYLLQNRSLDDITRKCFEDELRKSGGVAIKLDKSSRPHEHGRMLGFRAFAHVPTYEQDVVGMFAVIAQEIGFEIISNRNAFPDCEANRKIEGSHRKRYKKCLIEFELRSSDFKAHKHPVNGCDLIVCWEHDWKDCPLEVLELKKAIQPLSGWREN
jgi:hypothetical protein